MVTHSLYRRPITLTNCSLNSSETNGKRRTFTFKSNLHLLKRAGFRVRPTFTLKENILSFCGLHRKTFVTTWWLASVCTQVSYFYANSRQPSNLLVTKVIAGRLLELYPPFNQFHPMTASNFQQPLVATRGCQVVANQSLGLSNWSWKNLSELICVGELWFSGSKGWQSLYLKCLFPKFDENWNWLQTMKIPSK